MPSQVMKLNSDKSTAQIEAGESTIDIQLPLTFKGWSLVELVAGFGSQAAVVASADGGFFIGEVTGVDEGRYFLTVELT